MSIVERALQKAQSKGKPEPAGVPPLSRGMEPRIEPNPAAMAPDMSLPPTQGGLPPASDLSLTSRDLYKAGD